MLSPLLFTLLTHDYTAKFSSNHIIKFAIITLQEGATVPTLSPPAEKSKFPSTILTTFYRGTIESVLTRSITVWYGNCSAADCKTLQRTVNTAAKISCAPLPQSWAFFLHDAPAKQIVSWRTPPIPPTVSSSSYHQEDGTEPGAGIRDGTERASEHAPTDCSTVFFSPGCESPELKKKKSPRPYLKPHTNPLPPETWTITPPTPPNTSQPYHITEKTFICNSKCATHRWVGLYKPPVVTHSPIFALETFHTLLCVHNPTKRLNSICMFTCSCTTNHLTLFPSQQLDLHCFSLHMYSINLKHLYSLYSFYLLIIIFIFTCCMSVFM